MPGCGAGMRKLSWARSQWLSSSSLIELLPPSFSPSPPRHIIRVEAHSKVLPSASPVSWPISSSPGAQSARVRSCCRRQGRRASGVFSTLLTMANHNSAIVHVSPRTCTTHLKSTRKTCISTSMRQLVRLRYDDGGSWRWPIPAETGLVLAAGMPISSSQRA